MVLTRGFSAAIRLGVFNWRRQANGLIDSSEHSSRSSEAKPIGIEFTDLHVWKEDSVEPRSNQLYPQLFEAKYLADEDSFLVPADVAAIVNSSQFETLRVCELGQLARQSSGARDTTSSYVP